MRSTPASLLLVISTLSVEACDAFADASSPQSPYPDSDLIAAVHFDWSTHRREAPGSDNFAITWGADGGQYSTWGDGGGFGGTDELGRVSLGFARIDGDAGDYRGVNVYGGVQGAPASIDGKSYAILAVHDTLYAWVSPGSGGTNYSSASLMRSVDGGSSWDSTGVVFDGDRDSVALPAMLNFGPGYQHSRDHYVYHYFVDVVDTSDMSLQRPGRISLARSPVDGLALRSSYEWFAGFDAAGAPRWSPDGGLRAPVFEDEAGVGWAVAVSHNRGLGRYLLTTGHGDSELSNLGIFEASEPWGPWRVVHYGSEWGQGEIELSVFFWTFANRWLSEDGLDFVLVFSGLGENDSWNIVEGRFTLSASRTRQSTDRAPADSAAAGVATDVPPR